MDDVAVSEGKKACCENERLKESAENDVPILLQKKCLRSINRHFSGKDLQKAGHVASKIVTRIAVAALIAALLLTTAFAVSPVLRKKAVQLVTETFSDRTEFRIADFSSESASDLTIEPGWLPDGCALDSEGRGAFNAWKRYAIADDAYMQVMISDIKNGIAAFDSENADIQHVMIQGTSATLIRKEGAIQIIWSLADSPVVISVFGEKVDEGVMVSIAQNIIIK